MSVTHTMDVCSLDNEIEASFWRNHGPQNESILQLMTRTYTGLCDRIYKPKRLEWKLEDLEYDGFCTELFTLRTSRMELISCAYFEFNHEEDIFTDAGGEDSDGEGEFFEEGHEERERQLECACDKVIHEEEFKQLEETIGLKRVQSEEDLDETCQFKDTIVVYMHTNACNLTFAKEVLPLCKKLGASLLSYDLRGHGKSSGDGLADMDTNILDLERVVDWSKSKAKKVILWSRGLSTCVGISFVFKMMQKEIEVNAKLPANSFIRFENPIKYLVLDTPFMSMEQLLKDGVNRMHAAEYDYIPKNIFNLVARLFRRSIRNRSQGMDPFLIKPIDEIAQITIPASFILPTNDEYIPLYHGTEMASSYGGPIFARIVEADHYDVRTPDTVMGLMSHMQSHML